MATTFTTKNLDDMKKAKVFDISKKPGGGTLVMRTQQLDFTLFQTNTTGTLAVNDTFQMINVYPGEVVWAAGIINLKATDSAMTMDLGMTDAVVDFFVDGHDGNDLTDPTCTDKGFDTPFYCVTQDTIDLITLTAAGTGGKIMVWALISKLQLGNTATSTRRGRPFA
jgi:hypothetical protein